MLKLERVCLFPPLESVLPKVAFSLTGLYLQVPAEVGMCSPRPSCSSSAISLFFFKHRGS